MDKFFQNPLLVVGAIALIVLVVAIIAVIVICVKEKRKKNTHQSQTSTETVKTDDAEQKPIEDQSSAKASAPKTKKTTKSVEAESPEKETKPKTITTKKEESKPNAVKEVKVDEPKEEKNEVKKQEEPVEEVKERAQKYMITFDKEDKMWVVKKTNAKKASKKFKTKAEAYTYAERLANDRDMALTVKKKDGKFQKAENAKKSVKKTTNE